jgi:hypothetical protein
MADLVELARAIAELASNTRDPVTAGKLVRLVDQLLTEAGLPLDGPSPYKFTRGRQ